MDKDAFYFPHFCNARYDRKLRRVRKELGIEGYAIYFMILEVLREQEEFAYPISDIDLLSDDFGTTEAKVEAVVKGYDLFEIRDDKFFYSPRFVEYLTPYLERKELNKINGIKGNLIRYKYATKEELDKMSPEEILRLNENKGDLIGGESGGESQGDRKERKVKESKGKESKRFTPPSIDEATGYFKEKKSTQLEAEKFIDFYQSKNWYVGKSKMKDWKAAVRNWIRRNNEDKPPNQVIDGGTF